MSVKLCDNSKDMNVAVTSSSVFFVQKMIDITRRAWNIAVLGNETPTAKLAVATKKTARGLPKSKYSRSISDWRQQPRVGALGCLPRSGPPTCFHPKPKTEAAQRMQGMREPLSAIPSLAPLRN